MISLSWLTRSHYSATVASDLLVPLVNNKALSMTDPLTDRPPGRAPSLFITRLAPVVHTLSAAFYGSTSIRVSVGIKLYPSHCPVSDRIIVLQHLAVGKASVAESEGSC